MTHYSTQFSEEIKSITPEERTWLKAELARLEEGYEDEEGEKHFLNFGYRFDQEPDGTTTFLVSSEQDLDDSLTVFLSDFLEQHRPTEYITINYSSGASKPIPEAFGGGIVFLTANRVRRSSLDDWLALQIRDARVVAEIALALMKRIGAHLQDGYVAMPARRRNHLRLFLCY